MAFVDRDGVEWLTTSEVAALLDIEPSTIRSWVARRHPRGNPFPQPLMVGRSAVHSRRAVEEWEGRRVGQGARTDLFHPDWR